MLDGKVPYDKDLWKGLAEMGFLGVAIPEKFGAPIRERFSASDTMRAPGVQMPSRFRTVR